jgi:transposase
MRIKFKVTLTPAERSELSAMVSKGKTAAYKLTHARILLLSDESSDGPAYDDQQIVESLGVGVKTVYRVRKAFVEEGLDAALNRKKQINRRKPRLDGAAEAKLLAVACSKPPPGRARWTLMLLADKLVELEVVDSVSHECVRQKLKKTSLSLI